jgi:hypothetical protein
MPEERFASFNNTTVIAMRVIVPSACRTGVLTQAGEGDVPEPITLLNPAQ